MKANRSIPSATVIPVLIYPDVRAAVGWLAAAFGTVERILDADHHGRRDLARPRRALVVADVAEDHGAVAEAQLGAVVLADPDALDRPERRGEPVDGGAHVGIDRTGMTVADGIERFAFMRRRYIVLINPPSMT